MIARLECYISVDTAYFHVSWGLLAGVFAGRPRSPTSVRFLDIGKCRRKPFHKQNSDAP